MGEPVVLRNGVEIEEPLAVVLELVESFPPFAVDEDPRPLSIGVSDLRLANRGGARISATESAAILARRKAIDRALRAIAPDASLAGAASAVPWSALKEVFDAFAEVKGVGLSKMTKTLHPKRRALIPMPLPALRRQLAEHGHELTEVRILDLAIWSALT